LPYRILHCADLHLDRAFASIGCYGDLARRRRQGLREALQRIGAEAQRRQCDAVTIAGDLYEQERADPETGRFLAETFASWQPLRVVLAPGNHDPLQPGSLYARADWPDNVHLFTETALRPLALDDGLTLWGLAHRDPAWGGDPLVCSPVGDDGGVHLALFHGAELGSRPEGKSVHGPFRASRIADRGFSLALSGHYHRRRVDLGARLLYPGSPEPLSAWTALVVDCRLDEVESSSTAIQRVRETARAACASSDPERLMLRVDVRGEVPADVAVDVPLLEGVVTEATRAAVVRVRDLSIPAVDVAAALADRTTRGAFTREVLAMLDNATDPGERAVLGDALRYGLQALSGVEVGLR
jgi:hypothetical protein